MRLNTRNNLVSGCVTFHHAGKKEEENFILLMLYSHVKEWRQNWLLVQVSGGSPWLQEPAAPAVKLSRNGWEIHAAGEAFEPVLQ